MNTKLIQVLEKDIQRWLELEDFRANLSLTKCIENYYTKNRFIDYLKSMNTRYYFNINFKSSADIATTLNKEFGYSLQIPSKKLFGENKEDYLLDFSGDKFIIKQKNTTLTPSISLYLNEKRYDFTLKIIEKLLEKHKGRKLILVEIGCASGDRILPFLEEISSSNGLNIEVIGIEISTLSSMAFSKNLSKFGNLKGECIHDGITKISCSHIGKFINHISPRDSGIIISSRAATDPYIPLEYLKSFVDPFIEKIIGCAAYELDGMMLLPPQKRRSLAISAFKTLNLRMHPPQVWNLGDPCDDYINSNSNRKPNTFSIHEYINCKRPDLEHNWNIPIQPAYAHPGYYSFLI